MTTDALDARIDARLTQMALAIASESGRLGDRTLAHVAGAMRATLRTPAHVSEMLRVARAVLPYLRGVAGINEVCRCCDVIGPSFLHLTHHRYCPAGDLITLVARLSKECAS